MHKPTLHISRFRYALAAIALVAGTLGAGWHVSPLRADEASPGTPSSAALSAEVEQRIAELDDAAFGRRQAAAARLEQLAAAPEHQAYLAMRLREALLSDSTSFEVRAHLEPIVRRLPKAPLPGRPALDEIAPLIEQLDDDTYVRRDSAVRRLSAMLDDSELIVPLWMALKQRAADPATTHSERGLLEPLLARAHEAWLLADLKDAPLPVPSQEQIGRWIDEVVEAVRIAEIETGTLDLFQRTPGERELLDLIVRDDTREMVLAELHTRMLVDPTSLAARRLQHLVDFSRPGLAAEAWLNGHNETVQYLLVDVPQVNDAIPTPRATHFDRIDEQTAHCVTGNSLTEGDYPVRVGIPHPEPGRETVFYITNLPTARRRLAYEYYVQRDERRRLEVVSDRTLEYLLKRASPLSEVEIVMLSQLEPERVSRFVGKYFDAVPDARLLATPNGLNSIPTVHSGICLVMARMGTHEAVPALEKLARSHALGKPSYPNRIDLAWASVLAIAQRNPWPGVDEWLFGLIDETAPLTTDPEFPPEVGASAAGMLLDRHGASPRSFGLTTTSETNTGAFNFVAYRFGEDADRQAVKRWWQKQKTIAAAAKAIKPVPQAPLVVPTLQGRPRPVARPVNRPEQAREVEPGR